METAGGELYLDGNELCEDDFWNYYYAKLNRKQINYCPMCGRKLED